MLDIGSAKSTYITFCIIIFPMTFEIKYLKFCFASIATAICVLEIKDIENKTVLRDENSHYLTIFEIRVPYNKIQINS